MLLRLSKQKFQHLDRDHLSQNYNVDSRIICRSTIKSYILLFFDSKQTGNQSLSPFFFEPFLACSHCAYICSHQKREAQKSFKVFPESIIDRMNIRIEKTKIRKYQS